MKTKIINNIKQHWLLYTLLFLGICLNLLVLSQLNATYTIKSDDMSYIQSAWTFLDTGKITMHGYVSAQIMPGMTIILAILSFIFGRGTLFFLVTKLVWIAMAIFSMYGVYKIIRLFANKKIAFLASLFLLAPDFLWMNNVILTETPFMMAFIFLIYHSIRLADTKKWSHFWWIVAWYLFAIMLRPNIGIYPLGLFFYLLMKKYDFKTLMKQGIIASVILVAVLTPWTIRNYQIFHRFIPLTYGTGNPMLLGTYQGYNYPKDEDLDYKTNVDDKLTDEMREYVFEKVDSFEPLRSYYKLEYDGLKAKYRMQVWWQQHPVDMIKSYLLYKPWIMLHGTFYWEPVLHIPLKANLLIRDIDLLLTVVAMIAIIINKKYRKELFLLLFTYLVQVALYSYTFAYDRYGQTIYFIRFIIIGIGAMIIYDYFKTKGERKHEISH